MNLDYFVYGVMRTAESYKIHFVGCVAAHGLSRVSYVFFRNLYNLLRLIASKSGFSAGRFRCNSDYVHEGHRACCCCRSAEVLKVFAVRASFHSVYYAYPCSQFLPQKVSESRIFPIFQRPVNMKVYQDLPFSVFIKMQSCIRRSSHNAAKDVYYGSLPVGPRSAGRIGISHGGAF